MKTKTKRTFDLKTHLPLVKAKVEKLADVKLIVIDPITVTTGNARNVTSQLDMLAKETGAAILGIAHPKKNASKKEHPVYRILGSGAWGQAARVVWAIEKDANDGHRCIMWPAKLNMIKGRPVLSISN